MSVRGEKKNSSGENAEYRGPTLRMVLKMRRILSNYKISMPKCKPRKELMKPYINLKHNQNKIISSNA